MRLKPRPFLIAVSGAAVFALCTVASTVAIRWVIDKVIVPRFESGRVGLATAMTGVTFIIAIGLIRACGVIVRRVWAGIAHRRIGEVLAGQVIDRLVAQPLQWHQQRPTGELAARAGMDVDAATDVLSPLPFASSVVILIFVSCAWLLATDVVLGTVAIAVFPILTLLNLHYQHRVDRHFDRAQHHVGRLSAAVHESFEGVQVVKAFGAERRESERLAVISGELRDARIDAVRLRGGFEALLDAVPALANVVLIVLGASRIDQGRLTIGELSSVIYLFTLLVFPLRIIGYALSTLPHALAGWRRLREILDEPLLADPRHSIITASGPDGVALEQLGFAYDAERPVLSGVQLHIPLASTTALVGATGCGKTTLLRLIAGILPPDSGTVTLSGGARCYVLQEPFLLSGSIRDNITLGESYSDDDIWQALADAKGDDFVGELTEGLATTLGERGVSLSGGQRQRVALARALIRRPSVLLLDDTTSALDPGTEALVVSNLRRVLTDSTVLIVASRPSTIALAESVAFLDGGRVVAHASHAELMDTEPGYRELMEAFDADREETQGGADSGN